MMIAVLFKTKQSHPKTSYDWRLGTSFDHTSTSAILGYPLTSVRWRYRIQTPYPRPKPTPSPNWR